MWLTHRKCHIKYTENIEFGKHNHPMDDSTGFEPVIKDLHSFVFTISLRSIQTSLHRYIIVGGRVRFELTTPRSTCEVTVITASPIR